MNRNQLETAIQEVANRLEDLMEELLPEMEGNPEDQLFDAMRYSTLGGGKRLRPFLTNCSAMLFGVNPDSALQTAAAIEFVHSYSMIHDDLPAMDNDDYRRGKLSCHKKYNEATAILAGDALLTFAFEVIADISTHVDPMVRIELVSAIAQAAGAKGMVGGQMMDLLSHHKTLGFSEIVRLQRMKTGDLFAISCEAGAILGKAPRNLRAALKAYAINLGIAFQIIDDLLDEEGTREVTGKAVGKDKEIGKATLVSCIGIEQSREHAKVIALQAIDHLSAFDSRADLLRELASFVIERHR